MDKSVAELEDEYKKDIDLKRDQVVEILKWCKEQPHLPSATEFQIILFLKSCDYDRDLTKQTIDCYFNLRTNSNDIFQVPNEMCFFSLLAVLPQRTSEDHVIVWSKMMNSDLRVYNSTHYLNQMNALIILHLAQYGSARGLIIVWDLEGCSFGHFAHANWGDIRKVLRYFEHAAPYKVKAVHFINIKYFLYKALQIVRPFVRTESMNMIKFHNNVDSLFGFIPREFAPEDYGGRGASCAHFYDEQKKNYIDNIDLFRWLERQKADETKKPIEDDSNHNFKRQFGSFFWRNHAGGINK